VLWPGRDILVHLRALKSRKSVAEKHFQKKDLPFDLSGV
jgi:hypothetical protein